MKDFMSKLWELAKKIMANDHFQSWLATLAVYVAADCQSILVEIALGDWSGLTIKLLIVTVLRSIVKSLIVFIMPSTKPAIDSGIKK